MTSLSFQTVVKKNEAELSRTCIEMERIVFM